MKKKRVFTKTKTQPINWRQAQTVLKCLMADKHYNTALLFATGFYFGLRISDILSLKWEQIISPEFTVIEKKTGKERALTNSYEFAQIVSNVLSEMIRKPSMNSFVFIRQCKYKDINKPISIVAANKRIKNGFNHCGIIVKNPSSHTLRKTFGRNYYESNGKTEAALIHLGKIFNHRDLSTTREYIGLTKEVIQNAYISTGGGKADANLLANLQGMLKAS